MNLTDTRRQYLGQPLSETESHADPFRQFDIWFAHASDCEADPTAMAIATATRDGRPSVRMVLLKGVDDRGFVFYTNYRSQKAKELAQSGRASLLFYWQSLERQIRIGGAVEQVSEAESDAYFATRPLESRWSAYASRQSEVIESRASLESRFEAARQIHADSIPRPRWWGGYRVVPDEFEFWQGRENRLHDRVRYARSADATWRRERLAP